MEAIRTGVREANSFLVQSMQDSTAGSTSKAKAKSVSGEGESYQRCEPNAPAFVFPRTQTSCLRP